MQMYAGLATNTKAIGKAEFFFRALTIICVLGWLVGCTKTNVPLGHLTHVRGQLVDTGGRPVSQYPMKLEPLDSSSRTFSSVTDYSGDFEFADVPKGAYIVYPANRPRELGRTIQVQGNSTESVGELHFGESIKVDFNAAAAPVINDQAKQTINSEAARTINPEAAKTINPDAAKMINPAAARTINSEAAKTINPDAARVLNPERARVLTKQQAQTLTVQQAQEPPK